MQLSVLKTSVMVGVKLTSQKVTLTVYQATMGHCSLSFLSAPELQLTMDPSKPLIMLTPSQKLSQLCNLPTL